MKKLILMLFLVVGGVMTGNAVPKRLFVMAQNSYWANNSTGLNIYIWDSSNDTPITPAWPGSALTRIGTTSWFYVDIDSEVTTAACKINTNDATRWETNQSGVFDLSNNIVVYLNNDATPSLYPSTFSGYVLSKGYTSSTDKLLDLDQDGRVLTGTLDLTSADWDVTFQAFPAILSDGYYVGDLGISPASTGNFELSFANYEDAVEYGYTTDKWEAKARVKYNVTIDLSDNSFKIEPFFTSNISSVGYATFSSAYDVVCDADAYYASKAAGSSVSFSQYAGNKIPANEGALLKGSGTVTFTPAGETLSAPATNFLKASVTETDLTTGGSPYNYILAGSDASDLGFYYVNTARTSGAGKAYLQTDEALTTATLARVAMVFDDEAETTGIKELKSVKADGIFNLRGQRVMNAQKGLYIVNGKKMLMK